MDVKDLIDLMKREKVRVVKLGSMHVELDPAAFGEPEAKAATEQLAQLPVPPMPTEEEFLRWSLPESDWAEPKNAEEPN